MQILLSPTDPIWTTKSIKVAVKKQVTPPPPPAENITNYASLAEAVAPILAEHPQVIAFGEIHPLPGFTYRSTKSYFTKEILPQLAKEGIKDLVLESILTDPAIEEDLATFYATGCEIDAEHTPLLWRYINYSDKADLIALLKKCRELNIRVHAGGMTLPQAEETIFQADYTTNIKLKEKSMVYNQQATRARIEALLNAGCRIAVLGGLVHNNLSTGVISADSGYSYGPSLAARLGDKYVEVDLIDTHNPAIVDRYAEVAGWREMIRPDELVLLDLGQTRIIFLPQSPSI